MSFLIDENLPSDLTSLARTRGIEASSVRDVLPGAKDSIILDRLRETGEVLVTRDIRFANLVVLSAASGVTVGGVVLIREQGVEKIREAWNRFLAAPQEAVGITVLTAARSRFRRLVQ